MQKIRQYRAGERDDIRDDERRSSEEPELYAPAARTEFTIVEFRIPDRSDCDDAGRLRRE